MAEHGRPTGRPTDYEPDFCQRAANLCAKGATDFEVAEDLGVCVRTLYRWKAEYPEFCQALKVGKEAADERVELSLFHRAVGYSHRAVKIFQYEGAPMLVPYTEHVAPDVGAATLWLSNRKPDDWRVKQSLEHSGKNGAPIPIAVVGGDMTDADAMKVYAKLVGASVVI